MRRCRVLIAGGDPGVRAALRLLLVRQPDFEVVGECSEPGTFTHQLESARPDVVVLDGDRWSSYVHTDSAQLRNVATVVLGTRDEQRTHALAGGAAAFVCKGEPPSRLLDTLRELRRVLTRV